MKRILLFLLITFSMVGCTSNNKEEVNVGKIFDNEIEKVSLITEQNNKKLLDEIKQEEVENIVDELFTYAVFEDRKIEYGEVTEGIGSNGNGGRTFCSKLPVNIEFSGEKAAVTKFVEYFYELENVVSIGMFDIVPLVEDKAEDNAEDKYEVKTVVNFLGKSYGSTIDGSKKEYSIKQNKIEIEKVEDISLREFDISMTIRPSNSDSASITLGVVQDKDYRIYNDENAKKEVYVRFYNEGNKYYSEYKIGEENLKTAQIIPNGDIIFDILSCEKIETDDNICVDLSIVNQTSKKVSTKIFNDKDNRVNVIHTEGSVEVKK